MNEQDGRRCRPWSRRRSRDGAVRRTRHFGVLSERVGDVRYSCGLAKDLLAQDWKTPGFAFVRNRFAAEAPAKLAIEGSRPCWCKRCAPGPAHSVAGRVVARAGKCASARGPLRQRVKWQGFR
jgi:hypothetical protein